MTREEYNRMVDEQGEEYFMKPFYDILSKDKFSNVYREIYIENDTHFNEKGHKIIAENFLKLYKD